MIRILFALALIAALTACAHAPAGTRANRPIDPATIVGAADVPEWDTPPRLLSGKAPVYPISKLFKSEGGETLIEYTIGVDGRAHDLRIVETDDAKYANHAIIALKEWRFEPAMKDGRPIEARVLHPFSFTVR